MQALVLEGRVVQVEAEAFPVAEPLQWVACGADVAPGWAYDGQAFATTAAAVAVVTADDVIAERKRRLAAGFDYDFGDARGAHRIGTTEADMIGWDEVSKIALARHALGAAEPIAIITDTGPAEVAPLEWLSILEAASAFRQPIWAASFALQALEPIPADYADDARWP
jgi:hypothetical protein